MARLGTELQNKLTAQTDEMKQEQQNQVIHDQGSIQSQAGTGNFREKTATAATKTFQTR